MNTYFTKVQFEEYTPWGYRSILLLNIPEKTLSYQKYARTFAKEYAPDIPVIQSMIERRCM